MRLTAICAAALAVPASSLAAPLTPVTSFGSNPGALTMYEYVPAAMPQNAPLVVLLHGCSQTAESFRNAGWEAVADSAKIYLVYAQQSSNNNPVTCFNWAGEYGATANLERGQGENQSIKEMVDKMKSDHSIDASRVYVAGFSAGAAFSVVMLSTWPDVFAAGSSYAAVPYRCATTVQGAYDCMAINNHTERKKTPDEWGDLVRAAHAGYAGPWPRLLAVHGTADYTVHSENLVELVEQWTDVHGIDQTPDEVDAIGTHARDRHKQGDSVLVETIRVTGMGHAVPIDPDASTGPCGTPGAYVDDRGLCAAWQSAHFFGLVAGSDGGGGLADLIAPSVTLLNPDGGDEVSGWVDVEADASDDVELERVEFWVDGELKSSAATAPFTWSWQTAVYPSGDHVVEARALDTSGNTATDQATVRVAGGIAGDPAEVDPIPSACSAAPGRGTLGAWLPVGALLAALWRRRSRLRSP